MRLICYETFDNSSTEPLFNPQKRHAYLLILFYFLLLFNHITKKASRPIRVQKNQLARAGGGLGLEASKEAFKPIPTFNVGMLPPYK